MKQAAKEVKTYLVSENNNAKMYLSNHIVLPNQLFNYFSSFPQISTLCNLPIHFESKQNLAKSYKLLLFNKRSSKMTLSSTTDS